MSINWKDIAGDVGKVAPLLGTLLGGPAGAAVGSIVSSALGTGNDPQAVLAGLSSPDAAVKLKQIESDQTVNLQKLAVEAEQNRLAAETAQAQAVNASIQAEAKSDHWPTYTWRPFVGFVFGISWIGDYFVLPLLKIAVPAVPTEAWVAIGAILGIASYYRGKMQADPTIPTDNRG